MRAYTDYEQEWIGYSDIGRLIVSCPEEVWTIEFGDGSAEAWIVDKEAEIPEDFEEIGGSEYWCLIYDDSGLSKKFLGDSIWFFRKGNEFIVQVIE